MLEIINYNTAPILQIRNATYPFAVTAIANVTVLRATEPLYSGQIVILVGHTVAGVGGGLFYYDASDTTTADDNTLTIVTTGGKRWKRIVAGTMTTVNQEIAMTDSTTIFTVPITLKKIEIHAINNTVTLQQKFNGIWANCGITVPRGTFKVAEDIAQGTELRITGGNATIHYWA